MVPAAAVATQTETKSRPNRDGSRPPERLKSDRNPRCQRAGLGSRGRSTRSPMPPRRHRSLRLV